MHWLFILLFTALAVSGIWHLVVVYYFLQRLNQHHAAALREMGIPDAWDLVTNIPPNLPMQWKFMRSVWRDRLRKWNDATATQLANAALVTSTVAIVSWVAMAVLVILSG